MLEVAWNSFQVGFLNFDIDTVLNAQYSNVKKVTAFGEGFQV